MNIAFHYLYRDAANYKKFGYVIFANPGNVDLSELENLAKSKLIYGEWFYANQWCLPELFLDRFDFNIDPTWHEFECIEYTDEPTNSTLSLIEFIKLVGQTKLP